ncbi:MAG: PorV/PorQ family protein [Ignavibacteriales bacterium]|nr:PorV/PorQ family protein [Ignavibacteriales bacterium]
MFKKFLTVFILLTAVVFAQYERPGSTDGQFLKIGVSPRGTALGDAYIAVVDGAEGTHYNSASLAWLQGTDIVFNHNVWFAGINHDFAAIAHNFGDYGTFGLSVIGLYTDEMLVRTPLQPNGTGETFYAGNYKLGLTYSRYFTDRVTVGATFNYVNLSLYKGFSASAIAIDIATMYVSEWRGFKFAMQISNFGSNVKFVNESYPLPTNFTFGAAINAIELDQQTFLVSFAATKPNDGSPQAQLGGEWNFFNTFFARGGLHLNHEIAKYSFGAGFKINISDIDVKADYSYSDFSLLGVAHRFGIGFSIK